MSDCKKAFKELELCNAYGSVQVDNCVVDYEAINFTAKAHMPADFSDKLSNHLLSGNGDECKLLIEQIFETNISNGINYIKLEDITRSVFNIIINILSRYEYDQECITKFEIGFFEDVIKHRDYKKTRHFFWSIIDQVTEKINDRKQSKLSGKFIHDYINLHYIEDLCLESMAQITETSPKYFSSFFKKAMGSNFVDYLNKVRVNHAKELLKKAEMPIGEIGKRVGYPNLNTFARTFKKYCGISPSEYRKEILYDKK
jgi:YesN/AraC family two-component response regulator